MPLLPKEDHYKIIVHKPGRFLWVWAVRSVRGVVVSGLWGLALSEASAIRKADRAAIRYILRQDESERNSNKIEQSKREIERW